ncbi:Rhomboid-like protein 11 chloroplastic [Bienertia sinuspersici]
MSQVQQYLALRPPSSSSSSTNNVNRISLPTFNCQHPPQPSVTPKFHVFPAISLSSHFYHPHSPPFTSRFHLLCNLNDLDSMPQLELEKPLERLKPEKRANAIIWIILLNLVMYVADHILLIRDIKALYLIHNRPTSYQFVTASFCHANWNHLYTNLFFLYIFGKLVESEKGSFALWFSYILTGAGANLASWWLLPSNAVTIGSSGALFGLFAISVVLKVSMDWRRKLEVLMLGQFVIVKVMEAAQTSTGLSKGFMGTYSLQNVNHIAHISGAIVGVLWVWLFSRIIPSETEGLLEKPLTTTTNNEHDILPLEMHSTPT